MVVEDIGTILFQDILRIQQYPGSPFTGNPVNDLIMFFFLPSILLIIIAYMAAQIVLPPVNKAMRLLLSIGVYLFVIAGGYFPLFALSAPIYFLMLLLVAILFFIARHFRVPKEGSRSGGGGERHRMVGDYPEFQHHQHAMKKNLADMRRDLAKLQTRYDDMRGRPGMDRATENLQTRILDLEDQIEEVERDYTDPRKYGVRR